uniref:Fb29 n=1 Tax=Gossypium hirsutum TaxID=3635 RepID=Q4TZS9_GOSHI|nr:Fb29 [Gossypium hirsutum]
MDLSFKQIGMQMASGLGPRVVHSACFSALGYFAFETALAILHQYLEHKEKELSKISVAPA